MARRTALPALAVGWLLFVAAAPAYGFCRAKACDDNPLYDDVWQEVPDPPCDRDGNDCQIEGAPLYWTQTCLSFAVQKDASPLRGISYEAAHTAAVRAFDTWLKADCGGGKPPSFAVYDDGAVACHVIEFNDTQPNANVILFRDDGWDKEFDAANMIALTTVSYNTETAEMYDADIEVNSSQVPIVAGDHPGLPGFDLQAVLTHEVGHFLGLSHSNNPSATMFARYAAAADQRSLHPDDVAGICTVYPPGTRVDATHCAPVNGFSGECQPDEDDSGCSVARKRGRGRAWGAAFAALSLLSLLRRRRR